MNPLSIPFAKKPKRPSADSVPSYLGLRNEVVRDSESAEQKIKIQVSSIKGQTDATYEVEYVPGAPLKEYLDNLKLKHAAIYAAIRDYSDLSLGRLRLHYVPNERSHIVLGPPRVSSALEYQRSSVDAMAVAQRMGSSKNGSSPREVVVRLHK